MICKKANNCSKYATNYGNPYPHQSPCEHCKDYEEPELRRDASKKVAEKMSDIPNICKNCTGHIDLTEHDKRIKTEVLDEFISTIKPRMKWDNDIYTLAIEHCIEVAEMLKEKKQ